VSNRLNTYRVLLTRARYETVIRVPRGDVADRTRSPDMFDEIARFLSACGVAALASDEVMFEATPPREMQATLF